jgi:hypothetical protein
MVMCMNGCNEPTRADERRATDVLPSWRDGASRDAIIDFVTRVTTHGPAYVAPAERIAVFDNDGTLWSEQPMYNQLAFALARVKELAPSHPEWKDEEPFRSVLAGDRAALAAQGETGVAKLVAATHSGTSTDEFAAIVTKWIATAKHPTTGLRYTEMVYQPMLELVAHLRANGFTVFIVTGGGVEFLRPWAPRAYGTPPDRIVGSRVKLVYELRDGEPILLRTPEIDLVDDKAGKPVGIHQQIGRRPIAAFGNSDGDFEMLEWTTSARGARLGMIIHHTDGDREWAYDRGSPTGALDRALTEAPKRGWVVVDMKRDWRRIFAGARTKEGAHE